VEVIVSRSFLIVPALAFSLAVLYLTFEWFGIGSQLNFSGPGDMILATTIALFVMLAGVLSGALYRRISGRSDPISIGSELVALCRAPDFWSSLCISPLVFMATFALTKDDPLQISNLVLIYQNGFFCDLVFKKIEARLGPGNQPPTTQNPGQKNARSAP
jgi:hypothetical protein